MAAPRKVPAAKASPAIDDVPIDAEANPDRGELELELEGRTYRLRPSHAAIAHIERRTERSLLRLLQLGNGCDLSIEQLAIIATEFIRAGAEDEMLRRVDTARIGELIFEEGVPVVTARLTLCLLEAATGGRTVTGEAKAATA